MSAETLRRAATLMREQHGPDHKRHEMWAAMADWLDEAALDEENTEAVYANVLHRERPDWARHSSALTVARAYLGES